MSWVELVADRKIRDAQEEGKFDNLPGKGKPLKLDSDARVPAELRMAYRLMREANVLPDWIQVDKEIRTRREEWEQRVEEYARGREADLARRASRGSSLDQTLDVIRDRFLRRAAEGLRELNRGIDRLNLIVPSPAQQRRRIDVVAQMTALEERFPRLSDRAAPSPWADLVESTGPRTHLPNYVPARRKRSV